MTVEIDVSDIPLGSFYTDERCKRIERIIQSKEEYTEFRVKRAREGEDPSLDIYVAMDASENFWVWMYEWEVDALNDSEILSYFIVTKETSQRPNPTEGWSFILMSLCSALFLVFPIIFILVPEFVNDVNEIMDVIIVIMIVSLMGAIISGWIFKGKSKRHRKSEREFEIELMKRNPLYLEALRKFTTLQDITDSQREEYLERYKDLS